MGNFHSLEVVGRGSETQLQVSENSNYLFQRINPYSTEIFVYKPREQTLFSI